MTSTKYVSVPVDMLHRLSAWLEMAGYKTDAQEIKELIAASPQQAQHFDDIAIDRFAQVMKEKMRYSREVKGRGGWNDPSQCSVEFLNKLLLEHVEKGDPVDVANLCMMLQHYGAGIKTPPLRRQRNCAGCCRMSELWPRSGTRTLSTLGSP
jgi:hypothetical protein